MFLLDTHLVLWAAFEPGRLSKRATKLLRSREDPLAFSMATLWEVAIKTSLGKPGFSVDPLRLYQGLGRTVRIAGQTRRIGALAG